MKSATHSVLSDMLLSVLGLTLRVETPVHWQSMMASTFTNGFDVRELKDLFEVARLLDPPGLHKAAERALEVLVVGPVASGRTWCGAPVRIDRTEPHPHLR